MKKALLIIATLILTSGAYAQTKDVKGFQWGVSYRQEIFNLAHSQASANLSLGYRINRGNYVGVRSGYVFKGHTWIDADPGKYVYSGIPAIAEYTHYFPIGKARRHSIFAGAEGGWVFANYYKGFGISSREEGGSHTIVYNTDPVDKTIPYVGIKTGLDFDIADFTHLQFGIILNYVGFGVMAGLTF